MGRARAAFEAGGLPPLAGGGRFGAPPPRPGKIICIGLDYRDHTEETGAAVPDEPVVFMKAVDTMVGPDDEVRIPLRLWVTGELRQDGSTQNTIFGVDYLIWYLSRFMVLDPGDVITTGTPAGVAPARSGEPYLRPGDVVEVEIERLGRRRQVVA